METFDNMDDLLDSCNCLQNCEDTFYSYAISQSTITDNFVPTEFDAGENVSKSNQAYVSIGYDKMIYRETTMVAGYTVLTMLCDIGGSFSLMLGATLLTVYQFGEFLVVLAVEWTSWRRNGSKQKVANKS